MIKWMIFGLIALVLSVVNPYIGLFGTIIVVELMIFLCLDINVNTRVKVIHEFGEDDLAIDYKKKEKYIKSIMITWKVISVIFGIIVLIVSVMLWLLTTALYGDEQIALTPIKFLANIGSASAGILMIFQLIFNILCIVFVFIRCDDLKKEMQNPPKKQAVIIDYDKMCFKVGRFPVLSIFAAIAVGVLCVQSGTEPLMSLLVVFIHLFYFLFIFVAWITLSNYKKLVKKGGTFSKDAQYFLKKIYKGKKYNSMLIMIVWLIALIYIVCMCALAKQFDMQMVLLLLNVCSECLVAGLLTAKVRNIGT